MVPSTVVLTCEPCLAFLRTSPSPYRAGVPGRLIPIGSNRANRRRAVSRGWAYPRSESAGSELEVVLLARLFGQRGRPEAGWRPDRALRSKRWARAGKRVLFLLGLTFWLEIGSLLCPSAQVLGPVHEVCAICLGRASVWKPVPEGPRVYEPDNIRSYYLDYLVCS